jgi:hypothetical protein
VPTAAPWADVACRASPDGRPHRPQPKSGHRSRRPEKPTGSVCRSSPLPSCVLQMAPLSPAQAATTTRDRPQLRPQDWIRSQTPGSPPVHRSQTSAAATLRPAEQCRSSMAGSPGHQLADPDHQQWPARELRDRRLAQPEGGGFVAAGSRRSAIYVRLCPVRETGRVTDCSRRRVIAGPGLSRLGHVGMVREAARYGSAG